MRALEVAIAGAGVAGLAAAILLTRLGHRVVVFERFAHSKPVGSGLMIQPTGLAALDVLGLRTELEGLGARLTRLEGRTTAGASIFNVAYSDLAPDAFALGVHRAALHGVLWRAFERTGAAFEPNAPVAAIEPEPGGRIAAIADGGRKLGVFDLVLDASGARSTLRASVDPAPAIPFSYGAVWANLPDTGIGPGMLSQRYVAAHTMIGNLPVGRVTRDAPPLTAFFWSLKPAAYPDWRADFPRWRDTVAALWPELGPSVQAIEDPDQLTLAAYRHFTARRPYAGRLALIGDSAHATSPQLGQGANNGLLDACAIAAALAAHADLDDALAAYARSRRAHVRFYQLASAVMTPFFQSDSRLLASVRDLVFDRFRLIPWLRREMVRTLAGLKTGPLASAAPEYLASLARLRAALPEPEGQARGSLLG